MKQQPQKINEQEEFVPKTKQHKYLFDIFTTSIIFPQNSYCQHDFSVDLVLKLQIPKSKYISKDKVVTLNNFTKNMNKDVVQVYDFVEQLIFYESQKMFNNNTQYHHDILVKNMTTLGQCNKRQNSKIKDIIYGPFDKEQMQVMCGYEYMANHDIFTLQYNTIIYILRKLCGFDTKTYIFEDKETSSHHLYILMRQSQQNLIKLAKKYKIKKEVQFFTFDFYVNDPVDSRGRPFKINSQFRDYKNFLQNLKLQSRYFQYTNTILSRKIGVKNETQLSQQEIQFYLDIYKQKQQIFIKSFIEDCKLSFEQRSYYYQFNLKKAERGFNKQLKLLKKKRRYFQRLRQLHIRYNLPYVNYPSSFFEYMYPEKYKSKADKIKQLLMYKTSNMNANGSLQLFTKMERIKLSSLVLNEFLRIENIEKLNGSLFAINDQFQLFGDKSFSGVFQSTKNISKNGQTKQFVDESYHAYIPWLSNTIVIRNYFGSQKALYLLIKIKAIKYFCLVSALSIPAEVIKNQYFVQVQQWHFIFPFYILTLTFFNMFLASWQQHEKNFKENFQEGKSHQEFRSEYKGPYIRNIATDKINEFQTISTIYIKIKVTLVYLFILCVIGIYAGVFYGLRVAIVSTYSVVANSLKTTGIFFISPVHLTYYSCYFLSLNILNLLVIFPFLKFLVKKQNYSTTEEETRVFTLYRYILILMVQGIGPTFLLFIEPFQLTSCYAANCLSEYQAFIQSRYVIILFVLLIRWPYNLIVTLCVQDKKQKQQTNVCFQNKYSNLLTYVQKQSNKIEKQENLQNQVLYFGHYCLFSFVFPFYSVLAFFTSYLMYLIERNQNLTKSKRKISKPITLPTFLPFFIIVLNTSIILNIWTLLQTFKLLQYDLLDVVLILQPASSSTIDTILIIKVIITMSISVILVGYSYLVRFLYKKIKQNSIQERKSYMWNNFIFKRFEPVHDKSRKNKDNDVPINPIKSIFRTHNSDHLIQKKMQRFEKFKKDNHMPVTQNSLDQILNVVLLKVAKD